MSIFARRAYLKTGWAQDVRVNLSSAGRIAAIAPQSQADPSDIHVDTLLPALSNLHSHSFQRAMAGMTEFRQLGQENFWTWRALMYQFLDHLTPEDIGSIAQFAFMEMQQSGFAAVAEFHYLHHAPGGQFYDDPAELSGRILQAAHETGIGLTHLPVLYSYGDVGEKPLKGGQLRFGHTLDQFCDLLARCKTMVRTAAADTQLGVAPHSLRATSPDDLAELIARTPDGPIHIHIAEQTKEVEDITAALGTRPVEWLLDNTDLDARWCLIHATHMTNDETRRVAESGAVVGLCPVTEANLGDGIFNAQTYLENDGRFGIGTDSNINISVSDELRMLEYAQRLNHRQRNVMAPRNGSTGDTIFTTAAQGAAQALTRPTGALVAGNWADMMALDSTAPALCALGDDQLLDGFIFAGDKSLITDVWSAGRHQVQSGAHIAQDRIVAQYRKTMRSLMTRLA